MYLRNLLPKSSLLSEMSTRTRVEPNPIEVATLLVSL